MPVAKQAVVSILRTKWEHNLMCIAVVQSETAHV